MGWSRPLRVHPLSSHPARVRGETKDTHETNGRGVIEMKKMRFEIEVVRAKNEVDIWRHCRGVKMSCWRGSVHYSDIEEICFAHRQWEAIRIQSMEEKYSTDGTSETSPGIIGYLTP